MSKHGVHKRNTRNSQLDEALAALITCTRTRKRPLSLPQIAGWLEVAVSILGGYEAVAERIGITSKMLRQFSIVEQLRKPVRDLFDKRTIDSVDAATHLVMLPAKDQLTVARAFVDGVIDTSDLRAVVQWRKERPREPIDQLVEGVQDSKTQQHYVAEFVVRETWRKPWLLAAFEKFIDSEAIVDVEIDGPFGRLVLTRKGKHQLIQSAKELRVSSKRVITEILSEAIEDEEEA